MKSIHRPTLDEFIRTAKPFLKRDLFANILSIRLINRIQNGDYADYTLFSVIDNTTGQVCATAIKTEAHNLILSIGKPDCFTALAQYVSDTNYLFPGINGPEESTSAFASAWNTRKTNTRDKTQTLTPALRLQYYALEKIQAAGVASGHARIADTSDLPILNQWREEFAIEARLSETERKPDPERVARRVQNAEIMLWEDHGHPVCMVWIGDIAPKVTNIGPVYTPPKYRGNHYASACVTEFSRVILKKNKHPVLCADMDNPTSNAIYQRIGYKEKSIYHEYRF